MRDPYHNGRRQKRDEVCRKETGKACQCMGEHVLFDEVYVERMRAHNAVQ